jgi:hypothetical protein
MSDDPQDAAEQFDEDLLGGDTLADGNVVTSDEATVGVPSDVPVGIPFADADVTDESVSDRADREEPEVWEMPIHGYDDELERDPFLDAEAADERLEQVIELPERPLLD